MPDSYLKGKLTAYKLLCRMALSAPPELLPSASLSHLYKALHVGLAGPSPVVVGTILRALGARFLSRQLPGYSLLLLDLISAANSVLESSDLQAVSLFLSPFQNTSPAEVSCKERPQPSILKRIESLAVIILVSAILNCQLTVLASYMRFRKPRTEKLD